MKKFLFGFLSAACLFIALPLLADDIIRIEYGKGSSDRDMKWRVQRLEEAVDQLQRKVFNLENSKPAAPPASSYTTCYIKTPFDGTFTSTEPTETAAKAGALEKCNAKARSSIYCAEREMICGK